MVTSDDALIAGISGGENESFDNPGFALTAIVMVQPLRGIMLSKRHGKIVKVSILNVSNF